MSSFQHLSILCLLVSVSFIPTSSAESCPVLSISFPFFIFTLSIFFYSHHCIHGSLLTLAIPLFSIFLVSFHGYMMIYQNRSNLIVLPTNIIELYFQWIIGGNNHYDSFVMFGMFLAPPPKIELRIKYKDYIVYRIIFDYFLNVVFFFQQCNSLFVSFSYMVNILWMPQWTWGHFIRYLTLKNKFTCFVMSLTNTNYSLSILIVFERNIDLFS